MTRQLFCAWKGRGPLPAAGHATRGGEERLQFRHPPAHPPRGGGLGRCAPKGAIIRVNTTTIFAAEIGVYTLYNNVKGSVVTIFAKKCRDCFFIRKTILSLQPISHAKIRFFDAMEHDRDWRQTVENFFRMSKAKNVPKIWSV